MNKPQIALDVPRKISISSVQKNGMLVMVWGGLPKLDALNTIGKNQKNNKKHQMRIRWRIAWGQPPFRKTFIDKADDF